MSRIKGRGRYSAPSQESTSFRYALLLSIAAFIRQMNFFFIPLTLGRPGEAMPAICFMRRFLSKSFIPCRNPRRSDLWALILVLSLIMSP